jgi:hypothetical protein
MKKLLYILLFVPIALFGQENYSLSFDGVDDYIDLGEDLFSSNEGTISARVKYNNSINQYHPIFSQTDIDAQGSYLRLTIRTDSALFVHDYRLCASGSGNFPHAASLINLNENEWIDISVSSDGFNWKMYVNGFEYQYDISGNDTQSGKWFEDLCDGIKKNYIGRWKRNGSDDFFNGLINQIQVWDKSLTQEEIQSYITCPPSGNEEDLVGYWNFNEGSGNTVYDLSGNANHGVISGATYSSDVPEENCDDSSSNELSIIDQLNQSFDAWNTTIDLSAGWNMFGYGCPNPIDVIVGLSNHTESILITKDNNGAVYMPEWDFNGIGDFTPGFGYQIKVTEAIEGFSLCDWYVNDIPEDNIVSLQEENASLQAELDSIYGCTGSWACNYDETASLDDGSCYNNDLGCGCDVPGPIEGFDCSGNNVIVFDVGDTAFGGMIFYMDESGTRGLVAAFEDLPGTYEWGCSNTNTPMSSYVAIDIGTGYLNSMNIVNQGCTTEGGGLTAAQAALNYESGQYNDWYLPSFDEILQIKYSIGSFDGIEDVLYWSSSTTNLLGAMPMNIWNGTPTGYISLPRDNLLLVRAIRAFGNWTIGCIDSTACNYNSNANMADGTCDYTEQGYDCSGNYLITACPYDNYLEYNPNAISYNANVCINIIVEGCTDNTALNYNYDANVDNNSCEFNYGCIDYAADNFNAEATTDDSSCIYYGCTDPTAQNYDETSDTDDGSCLIGGCIIEIAENYNSQAQINDGSCVVYGCFLDEFPNYNEWATVDDGSCDMSSTNIFGCTELNYFSYNPNATTDNGDCYMLHVGQIAYGGIVFYVDETGQKGLVAAMEDIEGTFMWGCYDIYVSGADGQEIGTGLQNTLDILNHGCETENLIAAEVCFNYVSGDFSEWYLPSIDELYEMYNNTTENDALGGNIAGLIILNNASTFYWSSSEYNITNAYGGRFPDNSFDGNGKYELKRVRPISSFQHSLNLTMGCMDEIACNYNSEANISDVSCVYPELGHNCEGNIIEYIVGMEAEGGIVFYVDSTGQHGLVAALEDLNSNYGGNSTHSYEWGCYQEIVNGADGSSIATGYQNTIDIVNQGCEALYGGITAAEATVEYYVLGYTSNWNLPSIDELELIYNTIGPGGSEGNIGGFYYDYYWSSSESNEHINSKAWQMSFNTGLTDSDWVQSSYRVRPIRSF